jgi:molybdopterin synthase catalytic subunit
MKAFAIIGPHGERTALMERLIERLTECGQVGTIACSEREKHAGTQTDLRETDAAIAYEFDTQGWTATGNSTSIDEALDWLAPECEYAVVSGRDVRLPGIVLDEHDHAGSTIIKAETAENVDLNTVLRAIEELEPYVTLESLVCRVKRASETDRAGSIATFTGRVRARDSPDDSPTEYLEFETYAGVAESRMDAISTELEARDGVYRVLMHHRTGVIKEGEDIVFVVVLAGHRTEAFSAVSDGINRLKDEVPIFKKEVTADDEFWVHERT